MININIVSCCDIGSLRQKWDKEMFPESEYNISENSKEDIVWDAVFVFQSITRDFTGLDFRCREGSYVFISGEYQYYDISMAKKYDAFISPYPLMENGGGNDSQPNIEKWFALLALRA